MVSIDLSVVICKNRSNIGTATGCIDTKRPLSITAAAAAHGTSKSPIQLRMVEEFLKSATASVPPVKSHVLPVPLLRSIEFGSDRADLFVGDGFQVIHAVGFVDHGDKINLTVKIGRSVVVVVDTDIITAADLKQVVVCPGSLLKPVSRNCPGVEA